jgi:chorismate mutase / prephenate dehydratase
MTEDIQKQEQQQATASSSGAPRRSTTDTAADNTGGTSDGLTGLRDEINAIDEELIALLAKRRSLSSEIVEQKDHEGGAIRDENREHELLKSRIRQGRSKGLDAHLITRVFHEIIDDSLRLQQHFIQEKKAASTDAPKTIAFHGISGSYCQLAAAKFFEASKARYDFTGYPAFEKVVEAVSSGKADLAILPVENTTSGGISEVFDLLVNRDLYIIGEEKFRIDHCVVAKPGTSLEQIEKIYCSYLAFADCQKFLSSLSNAHIEYMPDSAMAAQRVNKENDERCCAIASEEAAEHFNLSVLKRNITNHPDNYIRYLIVAQAPQEVDLRIPCKTSLVMGTHHEAGALAEALFVFKHHGINLTKLESRPIPGNPWEEMFYLDFTGNLRDDNVRTALQELSRCTRFTKVMGSYPSNDLSRTALTPSELVNAESSNDSQPIEASQPAKVTPKAAKKKKSYTLASRDHKETDTVITVKGVSIGGDMFCVMAGPCSVESREQVISCAQVARENGAVILRGGCFKPRTSPYSFQGLGLDGVDILVEAGRAYSLPVITEVMSPEDVEPVAERVDMLQIGARNMQNFTLLKAVGRTRLPVLLKRGMSSSIEDLLNAAEYILAQGNQQVILCERGIRTFETATRSTLDLSAVPVLRRETHLPVIVDPSHAAGERDLVPPLAYGAQAVGAHGIIVEFHPEPEKALSDGPQALRYPQFAEMMRRLLAQPRVLSV